MNERILKLAASHFPRDGEGNICATPEIIAEFAELIVKECIQSIQNESMNSGDEWEDGLRIAEGAIKEHFGVEE